MANGDTLAIGREMVNMNRNINHLMRRPNVMPPSQNAWNNLDIGDNIQYPLISQQSQARPNDNDAIHGNINNSQVSQPVGVIEPTGTGFSSAAFRYALILAAFACQAADYDMAVFNETMNDMCKKNGITGMKWTDPTIKTIDHLCGGKTPSPQIESRKVVSPSTSHDSKSVSLRSRSPRSVSSIGSSRSASRDRSPQSFSDGHISGLSGSPLKSMTPLRDHSFLLTSQLSDDEDKEDDAIEVSKKASMSSSTPAPSKTQRHQEKNETGLTQKTSKIEIVDSLKSIGSAQEKITATQDLFGSYDASGKLIVQTSPSPVTVAKSGHDASSKSSSPISTPLSETQGLAAQCTAGSQSPILPDRSPSSSPLCYSDDSKSSYSPVSQKSAPLDRGRELVREAIKERPIHLLKNRYDKRSILHEKDKASVSQIREAIKKKEVSIPGGQAKKVTALLNNAAEYQDLNSEMLEIKWSRSKSQWQ